MSKSHFDVIIVGAGLSGIGAAHHIRHKCPDRSFAILESRATMGGTWDLFKYPGIRSDSDMYTLGYSFKPWISDDAIADGPAILDYINETAQESNLDDHIHYNHKVVSVNWTSEDSKWQIQATVGGQVISFSCNFLFLCSGYYSYDNGYTPEFEGMENFGGQIVHPQKWTEDIDYTDKKVVVIGSGATAVTLVPELAKKASLVTMLQRSPSYILNAPKQDKIAIFLRKILPNGLAYKMARWKNILMSILFFKASRRWPKAIKGMIMKGIQKELGSEIDVNKHFNPTYNPWDQRLCLVPDNDLFLALKGGQADIVTDHIQRFTSDGIELKSGKTLNADLIVTATGLVMEFASNITITVDGLETHSSDLYCYRGMMFSGVPNLALSFGYTNASWTLKSDLTCDRVCRLLNYMTKHKYTQCIPTLNDEEIQEIPFLDFSSGYVMRAMDDMPKQGANRPWRVFQNYVLDIFNFRYSSLKDKYMEFK